jgi:hypothetical protein
MARKTPQGHHIQSRLLDRFDYYSCNDQVIQRYQYNILEECADHILCVRYWELDQYRNWYIQCCLHWH